MAQSDAAVFYENLKMWDRPQADFENEGVLGTEDNVEQIVEDMFDFLVESEWDPSYH